MNKSLETGIKAQFLTNLFSFLPRNGMKDLDVLNNATDIKGLELLYKGYLDTIVDSNSISKENINTINNNLEEDIDRLESKISKVVEKLRGAILAERKITGSIFTTILPLINQQTDMNTTTATINDNIVYGISTVPNMDNLKPLLLNNLTINNLNVTSLNKTLLEYLENFKLTPKTNHNKVLEFTINLRGLIQQTSNLVLDLKEHAIFEIYINGNLYSKRKLSKKFIIPIDTSSQSVTVRCYETIHKTTELVFNKIGVTSLLYKEESLYESKKLSINETLNYLAIDTCDNSKEDNVEINYYISTNDREYEEFTPVSKGVSATKQSIITLDKDAKLTLLGITPVKASEGDIRYYIPDNLQNISHFELEIFLPNIKNIMNKEVFMVIKNDIEINTLAVTQGSSNKLFIDGKEIVSESIVLNKGIRTLIVTDELKNIISSNYSYIKNLIGSENLFINKKIKTINKDSNQRKYISMSIPELKDAYDLYGNIYIQGISRSKTIDTIKIKATLRSIDQKTVPYISRILIRGL